MQHKMSEGMLLDKDGNLAEPGYAFNLCKTYKRSDLKVNKLRLKEWDYYFVGNNHYGISATIADNNYMSLIGVEFIDFDHKFETSKTILIPFKLKGINFTETSAIGDLVYKKKNVFVSFVIRNGKRYITIHFPNFYNKKPLDAKIALTPTNDSSMVIATPFKKKGHFYYNQKINLLQSDGDVFFDGKKYDFSEDTYGVLDWGRGVWTYKNTWYWSSLSGIYNKKRIGFNLGYGFGDTSAASENMLFYNDTAYKLEDVTFNIPKKNGKEDYMSPWTFTSKSGDINLSFIPIYNRKNLMSIGIISNDTNQVFGTFSGTFSINGEKIYFKNIVGFAEKVTNKW